MTVREFLFFVVDQHVDLETEVTAEGFNGLYTIALPPPALCSAGSDLVLEVIEP